jgi:hypothetical protein
MYQRPGRPTNVQRAARAQLDRWYARKNAAIEANSRLEDEVTIYLAYLDDREPDDLIVEDFLDAWQGWSARRQAILSRPLSSF